MWEEKRKLTNTGIWAGRAMGSLGVGSVRLEVSPQLF